MKCEICGSEMVKAGIHTNQRGKFQRYKCQNCAIFRLGSEPIQKK
jgi:transposase-like protein